MMGLVRIICVRFHFFHVSRVCVPPTFRITARWHCELLIRREDSHNKCRVVPLRNRHINNGGHTECDLCTVQLHRRRLCAAHTCPETSDMPSHSHHSVSVCATAEFRRPTIAISPSMHMMTTRLSIGGRACDTFNSTLPYILRVPLLSVFFFSALLLHVTFAQLWLANGLFLCGYVMFPRICVYFGQHALRHCSYIDVTYLQSRIVWWASGWKVGGHGIICFPVRQHRLFPQCHLCCVLCESRIVQTHKYASVCVPSSGE